MKLNTLVDSLINAQPNDVIIPLIDETREYVRKEATGNLRVTLELSLSTDMFGIEDLRDNALNCLKLLKG